jgi:putative hydrolase of the HAD superfamily
MIKAIFFDLYGTLAGFSPSRFDIQSRAAADFGITLTEQGVLRGYAAADALMAEQNLHQPLRTLDKTGKQQFFAEYERKVLAGSGVEVDGETAMAVWRRVREIPYEMTIYADVEPVLIALRQSGMVLGVISNMNRTGEALTEELGLTGMVDFVVTSLEVGAEKPNRAIFNAALSRAGVAADEAVHVGDQLTSDIDGARGAGIHPVLIDRDGNHPGYCDAPKIAGLSELTGVFEAL